MSPFASLPKIFLRDEFGRAIRCVNRSHPGTLGGRARMWLARLTEGESTERELRQHFSAPSAQRNAAAGPKGARSMTRGPEGLHTSIDWVR